MGFFSLVRVGSDSRAQDCAHLKWALRGKQAHGDARRNRYVLHPNTRNRAQQVGPLAEPTAECVGCEPIFEAFRHFSPHYSRWLRPIHTTPYRQLGHATP